MYQGTVTVRFEVETEEEAESVSNQIRAAVKDINGIHGAEEEIWEAE